MGLLFRVKMFSSFTGNVYSRLYFSGDKCGARYRFENANFKVLSVRPIKGKRK